MNNQQKADLRNEVLNLIDRGEDCQNIVARLSRLGWTKSTIRTYFKAMILYRQTTHKPNRPDRNERGVSMIITKCDKQCIFVNMIGYCCLDDHNTNTKHTEAQCQRGQDKKAELNNAINRAIKISLKGV